jgi:hypothetical protein
MAMGSSSFDNDLTGSRQENMNLGETYHPRLRVTNNLSLQFSAVLRNF